jgi:nitrogen fixation-related uncharacterized protein
MKPAVWALVASVESESESPAILAAVSFGMFLVGCAAIVFAWRTRGRQYSDERRTFYMRWFRINVLLLVPAVLISLVLSIAFFFRALAAL